MAQLSKSNSPTSPSVVAPAPQLPVAPATVEVERQQATATAPTLALSPARPDPPRARHLGPARVLVHALARRHHTAGPDSGEGIGIGSEVEEGTLGIVGGEGMVGGVVEGPLVGIVDTGPTLIALVHVRLFVVGVLAGMAHLPRGVHPATPKEVITALTVVLAVERRRRGRGRGVILSGRADRGLGPAHSLAPGQGRRPMTRGIIGVEAGHVPLLRLVEGPGAEAQAGMISGTVVRGLQGRFEFTIDFVPAS